MSLGQNHQCDILVELGYISDNPRFIPFSRVGTNLVLNSNLVTDFQWWEVACVLSEPFGGPVGGFLGCRAKWDVVYSDLR